MDSPNFRDSFLCDNVYNFFKNETIDYMNEFHKMSLGIDPLFDYCYQLVDSLTQLKFRLVYQGYCNFFIFNCFKHLKNKISPHVNSPSYNEKLNIEKDKIYIILSELNNQPIIIL